MRWQTWTMLALAATAWSCGGSSTGSPGPSDAVNGCSTFMDATAAGASRTVTFTFPSYSPPCLSITAGQTVAFQGSFQGHPLKPGVAPSSSGSGSAGNPIGSTSSGSSVSFTFPAAGTYPYYCGNHFGSGMFGAIQVK